MTTFKKGDRVRLLSTGGYLGEEARDAIGKFFIVEEWEPPKAVQLRTGVSGRWDKTWTYLTSEVELVERKLEKPAKLALKGYELILSNRSNTVALRNNDSMYIEYFSAEEARAIAQSLNEHADYLEESSKEIIKIGSRVLVKDVEHLVLPLPKYMERCGYVGTVADIVEGSGFIVKFEELSGEELGEQSVLFMFDELELFKGQPHKSGQYIRVGNGFLKDDLKSITTNRDNAAKFTDSFVRNWNKGFNISK